MRPRKDRILSELYVLQHRRGDPGSFEKLVDVWEQPLYYYLRRIVPDVEDAKDLSQEIWLTVFLKLESLRDTSAFPAWLYTLARRRAANWLRGPFEQPVPESVAEVAADSKDFLRTFAADEVHFGLRQISPLHSEVLVLHFIEGFTLEEVSQITGAPLGTVKSRIHFAKKALVRALNRGDVSHG